MFWTHSTYVCWHGRYELWSSLVCGYYIVWSNSKGLSQDQDWVRSIQPVYCYEETTISGIGQSSSLGPALWALINSFIVKMYKAKGHDMKVSTIISKQDVSLLDIVSINDADLVCGTDDVHTTGTTMIRRF